MFLADRKYLNMIQHQSFGPFVCSLRAELEREIVFHLIVGIHTPSVKSNSHGFTDTRPHFVKEACESQLCITGRLKHSSEARNQRQIVPALSKKFLNFPVSLLGLHVNLK
jgi:hypothetical protein